MNRTAAKIVYYAECWIYGGGAILIALLAYYGFYLIGKSLWALI